MQLFLWSLLSLLLLIVGATSATATGGAWTRPEGGYYTKIGLTWLSAEEYYDLERLRRGLFGDNPDFQDPEFGSTDINLYGEYGFTDWLTATLSTQYKTVVREAHYVPNRRDTTASASGLSDIWLSGRLRLLPTDLPMVAALTLGWKIPTGSSTQAIALGTGVPDYELALAGGAPFAIDDNVGGYAQVSGGYRLRNKASNEFNWLLESGLSLGQIFLLQGRVGGTISTSDFDAATSAGATALVADQSFSQWSLGVIYALDADLELEAAYGRTIGGRNTLASSSLSVGLAWKR